MIRKPFAAFGHVLYANYYESGYTVDAVTSSDSKTVLMFTEGSFTIRDKETGEVAHECVPGWINYGDYQDRLFSCKSNTDSVSWCYDPQVNKGYVPPIEKLEAKAGDSLALPKDTNLFLCFGSIRINGVDYVAPRQIAVKSSDVVATAVTNVYGLNFK